MEDFHKKDLTLIIAEEPRLSQLHANTKPPSRIVNQSAVDTIIKVEGRHWHPSTLFLVQSISSENKKTVQLIGFFSLVVFFPYFLNPTMC